MGKVTIVLSDQLEERLRAFPRKKGDLSKIVEQALEAWLAKKEEAEP